MKKNKPLLSIVIPTRNRQKYAKSAVESILENKDNRLELIIQDNSDERTLDSILLDSLNDIRLLYNYTPPPLSSVGNFNEAIRLASGEYVCVIGDDDGINHEIIEFVDWAASNNLDAIVGSLSANYRWAGSGAPDTIFTKMTDSTLTLTHFSGNIKYVDINKSLSDFARCGYTYYIEFDLPKVYHGVVRRSALDHLLEINGDYIKGLSPDIYLSIALSTIIKTLVIVDYPLTLPGVCRVSSSINEGQINNHSRDLQNLPHLVNNPNYIWSEEVPPYYCIESIWVDSALHALRDMRRKDLLSKFNYYQMYAHIINRNSDLRLLAIQHMLKKTKKSVINEFVKLLIALITGPLNRFLFRRCLNRLLVLLQIKRLDKINNIPDMVCASKALQAYLKKLPVQYRTIILNNNKVNKFR